MADQSSTFHVPVLLAPILAAAGGAQRAVDATLGDGGHAAALLEHGLEVLGIDRDPDALAISRARLGAERIQYLQAPYASPEALAAVAAIWARLHPARSRRFLPATGPGGPRFYLPSRRSPGHADGSVGDQSAADLLNTAPSQDLETIFRDYGDERRARRLASEIVRRRDRQPFATSDDLVNAIRATLGAKSGPPDFARLFQAVRIAVNDEPAELERALSRVPRRPQARRRVCRSLPIIRARTAW